MSLPGALRSVVRGFLAGAAGTAAMMAPAQVAKRLAELTGRRITKKQVPWVTQAMHWAYGISWGPAYALVARERDGSPVPAGLALGTGVWAASYAQLVPLGIYEEPWRLPPQELALDLSYHMVYGLGVATAYGALAR